VMDTTDGSRWLFKKRSAEQPVERAEERGIQAQQQAPREVAGQIAGEAIGVPVPDSRLATVGGEEGVLIAWHDKNSLFDLAAADPSGFIRLIGSEEFRGAMRSVDALDYLINNLDRGVNFANYLYEFQSGVLKVTPIDHALSFTSTAERADIVGQTRGLPESYPSDLAQKLKDLHANPEPFLEKIRPLVGDAAVDGVRHRLDVMYNDMLAKQQQQ